MLTYRGILKISSVQLVSNTKVLREMTLATTEVLKDIKIENRYISATSLILQWKIDSKREPHWKRISQFRYLWWWRIQWGFSGSLYGDIISSDDS